MLLFRLPTLLTQLRTAFVRGSARNLSQLPLRGQGVGAVAPRAPAGGLAALLHLPL
ncbi:MAG: hypothetical protein J2P36_10320 [Ktedonobacteraceae bacterium]|nr:hypothetical protein [Ktedonobacteraceae bacterium]